MEFDKNISDWSHSCTDHKNGIDFFMRLVKWPKIDVKKCQNLIFKVDFQCQKSSESFWKRNSLENINLGAHFLFLSILCSMKIEWLLFLKFLTLTPWGGLWNFSTILALCVAWCTRRRSLKLNFCMFGESSLVKKRCYARITTNPCTFQNSSSGSLQY